MKSDTAFMIPVFTHSVANWSDYKEEISIILRYIETNRY